MNAKLLHAAPVHIYIDMLTETDLAIQSAENAPFLYEIWERVSNWK